MKTGAYSQNSARAAALAFPFAGLATTAHAAGERFVFVSHSPDSDTWWNVIENALKDAEHDLGMTVQYRNPPTGDIADMAHIIEQATASNPDGIVTTISDFNVLNRPLKGPLPKASRSSPLIPEPPSSPRSLAR